MGAAIIVGGSLVMTTLIGIAAIVGMLVRGDDAPTILFQLTGSFEIALLCTAGNWLMSLIGGYRAAAIAGEAFVQHGLWTGALATPLNLAVLVLLGDSGPSWLAVLSLGLILPCAALGGWFASPLQTMPVATHVRQ
jgi:hypothetical protein